jgi:tryptophan 2,3-dioxygenase
MSDRHEAAPPGEQPDAQRPACGGRSFGEEGGRLSYGAYLRLPALLAQQVPESDPPAHDELLFITVHQAYELWFAEMLFELSAARDALLAGDSRRGTALLCRVSSVWQVLIAQIPVLETMTPQDFLAFRSLLAPASGFQSVQFREIEFVSGAKDARYLDRLHDATDVERSRLRRRLDEPSLWDGYLAALAARSLDTGDVEGALLTVARDRSAYGDLWEAAEALLTHDELAGQWRFRHVQMVERQIGTKSGTGGSTGAPYLRSRLGLHFFPALWDLRSAL